MAKSRIEVKNCRTGVSYIYPYNNKADFEEARETYLNFKRRGIKAQFTVTDKEGNRLSYDIDVN